LRADELLHVRVLLRALVPRVFCLIEFVGSRFDFGGDTGSIESPALGETLSSSAIALAT